MTNVVAVEKEGPVARLILNRPEKHNALRFDEMDELVAALRDAEYDDDIKVIILKGNGPSFCAGHDYNDAVKRTASRWHRMARSRVGPASA